MTSINKTASSSRNKTTATTAAALFAILASTHVFPARAFQPSFLLSHPGLRYVGFTNSPGSPSVFMRNASPWGDFSCGMQQPFRGNDGVGGPMGFPRWPGALVRGGPMVFSPPSVFQDSPPLQVREPEVHETEQDYVLTFTLPADVDEEDFDVSVSGRILTVKAKITQEESGKDREGGRWVSRFSRTDSVSRSFVLPENVATTGVRTSTTDDGKVAVKLNKLMGGAVDNDSNVEGNAAGIASSRPSTTAVDDSAVASKDVPGEEKIGGDNKIEPSSACADYLSGLSGRTGEPVTSSTETIDEVQPSSLANGESPATSPEEPGARRRPRSAVEALDQEFGEFAKLMWGEGSFKVPTEEEMAAKVEKAREYRAKRVISARRARMAADIFEENGSYIVRVALPEKTTRDDVKLTVTPDNLLRVSFSSKGRRSISKDMRLPRDAQFSEISAKFQSESEGGNVSSPSSTTSSVGGVSGLEVTVGKATPPEPQRIDIL